VDAALAERAEGVELVLALTLAGELAEGWFIAGEGGGFGSVEGLRGLAGGWRRHERECRVLVGDGRDGERS